MCSVSWNFLNIQCPLYLQGPSLEEKNNKETKGNIEKQRKSGRVKTGDSGIGGNGGQEDVQTVPNCLKGRIIRIVQIHHRSLRFTLIYDIHEP
jgi:hypothetical protein